MYDKKTIEFKTEDNITLRGWLYTPTNILNRLPAVIMTHGFSALKEHHLHIFAEFFVEQGLAVLVYDQRNFGDSDCEEPFEINPIKQTNDLQQAITFIQSLTIIDPQRIGLWGTSFSGGHVLCVAARDKRVRAVVSQAPFVSGHHEFLQKHHPEMWVSLQKKYAMDKKARAMGKKPCMTPVVTSDPSKSAVMKQPEAYLFFTSVAKWKNQVTLRSLEYAGEYKPIRYVQDISPTPVLFIVADQDDICLTELALKAYEKTLPPKKLVMIKGNHFSVYREAFQKTASLACEWFLEKMKE